MARTTMRGDTKVLPSRRGRASILSPPRSGNVETGQTLGRTASLDVEQGGGLNLGATAARRQRIGFDRWDTLSEDEKRVVASIIAAEQRSNSQAGQLDREMIAGVMINRALARNRNLYQVATDPDQFAKPRDASQAEIDRAIRAVESAVGKYNSGTLHDAQYFHASNVSPSWARSRRQVSTVEVPGQAASHTYYSGNAEEQQQLASATSIPPPPRPKPVRTGQSIIAGTATTDETEEALVQRAAVRFNLAGKERSVRTSGELSARLSAAVASVDPSLSVEIFSGEDKPGEQFGSPRHTTGNTADFRILRDGKPVPTSDPIHAKVVGALPAFGINEIGVGMRGGGIHAGFGSAGVGRPPAMWAYPGGVSAQLRRFPEHVKAVQQRLGLTPDGIYGEATRSALANVDTARGYSRGPTPKPRRESAGSITPAAVRAQVAREASRDRPVGSTRAAAGASSIIAGSARLASPVSRAAQVAVDRPGPARVASGVTAAASGAARIARTPGDRLRSLGRAITIGGSVPGLTEARREAAQPRSVIAKPRSDLASADERLKTLNAAIRRDKAAASVNPPRPKPEPSSPSFGSFTSLDAIVGQRRAAGRVTLDFEEEGDLAENLPAQAARNMLEVSRRVAAAEPPPETIAEPVAEPVVAPPPPRAKPQTLGPPRPTPRAPLEVTITRGRIADRRETIGGGDRPRRAGENRGLPGTRRPGGGFNISQGSKKEQRKTSYGSRAGRSSGGGTVICTWFRDRGWISYEDWRRLDRWRRRNYSRTVHDGYVMWAGRMVEAMDKHTWLVPVAWWILQTWSRDVDCRIEGKTRPIGDAVAVTALETVSAALGRLSVFLTFGTRRRTI